MGKPDDTSNSVPGGLRRHPWALVEAVCLALKVELALRRRPFGEVLVRAGAPARVARRRRSIPPQTFERAVRIAYLWLPFEATCLKQSLVWCLFRKRRGLSAELRIGVRKRDGLFTAHAWVEDESGNVLTDPHDGFSSLALPRAQNPTDTTID